MSPTDTSTGDPGPQSPPQEHHHHGKRFHRRPSETEWHPELPNPKKLWKRALILLLALAAATALTAAGMAVHHLVTR